MPVKHKFTSAATDGADATLVRPSNWNDTHDINNAVDSISVDTTLTDSHETVMCTAALTATLPTAVGRTGKMFEVINTGTGTVTISTTSSQTISGNSTYLLVNQYQYVLLRSTGSNWVVVGAN